MSDADDIEILLAKAQKHAKRIGAFKMALVCLSTFGGAAFGVGEAAGRYLSKILDGQDRMLEIVRGQDVKLQDLQATNRTFGDRLATLDASVSAASQCCAEQRHRIDGIYGRRLPGGP